MFPSVPTFPQLFRPSDDALSVQEKTQVQAHRLLTVLGIVLVFLFGLLYEGTSPHAVDPMWARLAMMGLFAGLLGASYVFPSIRRQYVTWMRGGIYALMGWFAYLTVLNSFAGNYALGLFLVYAVLTLVVALGAQSLGPVLRFLATGFVFSATGVVMAPAAQISPLILLSSLAALALVEVVVVESWLSAREDIRRRSDAMETASDGIAILNADGVYMYVNQAHAEVYGYESPEAFLGEQWTMCYADDELRRFEDEVMPELLAEGEWRGEATGRTREGTPFPQELTLTARPDGGIVCVVRDVTERRARERRLREAKEEAEEASRLKSAMLANMSHEVRTPLTSIIGFAEVIADRAPEGGDESIPHFAQLIQESGRRLLETLDAVLNLSKLEAGEMELAGGPVELGEEATAVTERLRHRAEEKGLTLEADAERSSVWAAADREGVQIIVRNLLSNAIKYTAEGGTVTVQARHSDAAAQLTVVDTGVGMEPDNVPKLFEPFRQESEGLAREHEGSGLGLSIVKKVANALDGDISVDTAKGDGTRITVSFPQAERAPAERPSARA